VQLDQHLHQDVLLDLQSTLQTLHITTWLLPRVVFGRLSIAEQPGPPCLIMKAHTRSVQSPSIPRIRQLSGSAPEKTIVSEVFRTATVCIALTMAVEPGRM